MHTPNMLIKVRENEFTRLLNRYQVTRDINQFLSPWTDLMRDVVNYGSNLIPRCYSSSQKGLKDMVVLAILLRQAVAMLDAVELLLSGGATHAAHLQLRALFEASVYIDWILLGDSETKATYYYVHNLRRKRLWADRMQPGSTESKKFSSLMEKSGVEIRPEIKRSARRQVQEIDRILSQPELAGISSDIEKHRNGRPVDPAWYVPLGESNLRTMARTVGQSSIYLFLYAGASEVMHTSSYEPHVKIGDGELTFRAIRSVEGFETVFRFSMSIAFATFRSILREYREGELPAFSRKYVEKWQRDFMNFPKIQFQPEVTKF